MEGVDVGRCGAEDAAADLEEGAIGAPLAFKAEDEGEEPDVEEQEEEGDFRAHGRRKRAEGVKG